MQINEMHIRNNAFFRQLLFIAALLTIGVVVLIHLKFFVGSFLGAITLYVMLRNPTFTLIERYRWRPWFASVVLSVVVLAALLAIGFSIFKVTVSEIPYIDGSGVVAAFKDVLARANETLGFNLLSSNVLSKTTSIATTLVSSLLNTTYSLVANVLMMILLLFFMLANGRAMEASIYKYLPMSGESLHMLKEEVKTMIYSNAIGIPLIMLLQGIAFFLLLRMLGVDNAVFWAFLTALTGLIPVVGTSIVYVPMGIYMISAGNVWQGIILIGCGLLIISNIDNLTRIILMKKVGDTHPLVVVFGVMLGIPLFGFWGIIFGPLLISGFLLLIKIYYNEYGLTRAEPLPVALKTRPRRSGRPGRQRKASPETSSAPDFAITSADLADSDTEGL